ncbi:MAG: phytoene desaturase family protein, partial [Thermodesulfobacteriota bacterium]
PFLGLPPSKVSAVGMCALIMSYFDSGAYRTIGGCQKLVDTLVKGIKKNGGSMLFNSKASYIPLENNRAIAVRTSDGTEYTANSVVSNIDFFQTFTRLLDRDSSNSVIKERLKDPGISSSFFILYIGTDIDLKSLYNSSSIGYFPSFNMERFFESTHSFGDSSSLGITIPTILDDTMAPRKCHAVSAHEATDYSFTTLWKDRKTELSKKILKKVEKILPGIQEKIIHLEAATPATLKRYTANYRGSAYGWQQIPGKRLVKSGVSNLYTVGHWGDMGGGVLASAYSGFKVARDIILKGEEFNPLRGKDVHCKRA